MQRTIPALVLCLMTAGVFGAEQETTCACGQANNGTYPFVVTVVTIDGTSMKPSCGAAILNKRHVVTTAHCTREAGNRPIAVITADGSETIRVSKIVEHGGFNPKNMMNDIAMLTLEHPLEFDDQVGPVCVPNMLLNNVGKDVKVLGFKESSGSIVITDDDARVNTINTCKAIYREFVPNPMFPTQFCTKQLGSTCMSRSGSPVLYLDPATNRYVLVGLVSYGNNCDSKAPLVETDVSVYMRWITPEAGSGLCHKV